MFIFWVGLGWVCGIDQPNLTLGWEISNLDWVVGLESFN